MQKQNRRAVSSQAKPAREPFPKRARKAEESEGAFVTSVRGTADRLYRAASECLHQRERYARMVDAGTHQAEQRAALRVACLCDELMFESARTYADAVKGETTGRDGEWWHKANALWHACREYERRHQDCDERSKQLGARRAGRLEQLALQYDLEASALLALRLAVQAYRKACPEAELADRPQTIVA
jgi:hypothetical protein